METYLKKLVSLQTVSSDKEANNAALDYLQNFFEARGMHVMRYSFNGHGSFVATTGKHRKRPKVLLAAHVDVIPGPLPVFELRQEHDKYYGRGVFDMKFAIAAYMEVVDALSDNLDAYDFGIMITTDEESGGQEGTRRLIEIGYLPEVCILPDGARDWQIETFAKGFIYGHIAIEGKASHGSTPWEGDSATLRLVDVLHELKQHFADQTLNTNTLNVGVIYGGDAINQVPAHARADVDIRFTSNEERQKIESLLTDICQRQGVIFTQDDLGGHPCVNELSNPFIAKFVESIEHVTDTLSSGTISYGASDARYFAPYKVPCIITRPKGGGQHADSEWIDKRGCDQYHEVILDYLDKIASLESSHA